MTPPSELHTASTQSLPSLAERVCALLARIPRGHVMTYGQIALLCEQPKAARQVGFILHGLQDSELPWHRVINAQGRVSTHRVGFGDVQEALLRDEGIEFDATGRCDVRRYQWWPDQAGPVLPSLL